MTRSILQASDRSVWNEIAKSLHEGLLILNHDNFIEFANESARKILGLSTGAPLQGKHIGDLSEASVSIQHLLDALAGECAESGSPEDGSYSIRLVRQSPGTRSLRTVVLHNTCSTKAAQTMMAHTQTLERTNKELDQFAHIVSHDLKAPLRAINNLSMWLEEDLRGSLTGDNLDMLRKLRGRVTRMESLINGILEYSKVGREEIPNEIFDVRQLVSEVIELLAPPDHIRVTIDVPPGGLEAPKTMLIQVFSNLISNAIKYNNKSIGLIRVGGREMESHFEFVVEDNGPGIPPEFHEKIFMIFQTLQSRDKFESTGIGLTIVKRILEARGGSIRIESPAGGGSSFIFTWPK